MARLEAADNNLVFATMDRGAGQFRQHMAALASAGEFERPDGIKIGPALGFEFGWPGAVDLVRQYLGETALVMIDHRVTGRGSEEVAQDINEVIAASGANALMLLPDPYVDAETHVRDMQELNPDITIVFGPYRGTGFSERHDETGLVDMTWEDTFKRPIGEWNLRDFYVPGIDRRRIERWLGLFRDACGGDAFRLWFDSIHSSEGGMAKTLQAAGGNANVLVSPYGNYPLSRSIADVRVDFSRYTADPSGV